MQLSYDRPSRLARFCFAVLMTAVWSGMPQCSAGQQPPAPRSDADQLNSLADGFDRYAKLVSAIPDTLDRSTFDPKAVSDAAGRDPGKLVEWVGKQTRYVPYRGCLRGPIGVLMDRCGNSLDRALLLATLLRVSGVTARLAHGTLAEDRARELMEQSAAAPPPARSAAQDPQTLVARIAADNNLSATQVKEIIESRRIEAEKAQEDLVSTVADQSTRLIGLLSGEVRPAATPADSLTDAADHWWVQYRAGDAWTDADPQARDSTKPLCAASDTIDLPDDWSKPLADRGLLHQVGVRVRVERRTPAGAEQLTALDRSLAPAQLIGKHLVLNFMPMQWPADADLTARGSAEKIKSTLLAQHSWLPMLLVDGKPSFDSSFDEQGKLDPKPSLDALGKAGGALKSKLSGVLDAFGDATNAPTDQALTAVWLEYDIKRPGHDTQTVRRDIYDLIGPAARAKSAPPGMPKLADADLLRRSAALCRSIDLLPAGCAFSTDFAELTAVSDFQRQAQVVSAALRQAAAGAPAEAFKKLSRLQPQPINLLALASLRRGPAALASGFALDQPNLFSQHRGLKVRDDGSVAAINAIDIVANTAPTRGKDAFARAVRQGVLEGQLERTLIGAPTVSNTAAIFAASPGRGVSWKLIKNPADEALGHLALSDASRARISADLAAGYVVVAPERPVALANHPYEGWWRVDPRTGNTIGFMADGMGSSITENTFLIYEISMLAGLYTFAGCGGIAAAEQGNNLKALGCAACGVAVAALTFFGGLEAAGIGIPGAPSWAVGAANWRNGTGVGMLCNAISAGM